MAKCIRVVGQGIPLRTTDEDAFQIVEREHDGEYCSKSFYKNFDSAISHRRSSQLEFYANGGLDREAEGRR